MTREWARKVIHLSTAVFPAWYGCCATRAEIMRVLLACTLLLLLGEVLRLYVPYFKNLYLRVLAPLLRPSEKEQPVNGATYLFGGLLLAVVFFSREIALAAMWIVIVSDTAASLTGQHWGRHKLGRKSVEGSVAFALSASVILMLLNRPAGLALGAGTLLSILELMPNRLNDNVLIPMGTGVLLTLIEKVIY
ncbi:MAG: hypothetical protein D6677_10850 [Calditrichaeota bacterium]|nr:MAG: hypothetical protein D6677_10850 [Calditrichota bacterium]